MKQIAETSRAVEVACDHCGLPVPSGLVEPDDEHQFCCSACKTVYEVIHSCGLERYYELKRLQEEESNAAVVTGRAYQEFDDEAFARLYVRTAPSGLASTELYLEGVHCVACVWLVEKLPQIVPGVMECRLDLTRSLVRVVWDPERVSLSRIGRALDSLGYPPHPARGGAARAARKAEDRRSLVRIAVAGALAGNVMLVALALYSGALDNAEGDFRTLFRWMSMILGGLSLLWPGRVFFKGALAAIRTRSSHLDLPIALALFFAAISGVVNVVRGSGEIYFDSIGVLVFLLLVGRWIQHRQQRSATDSIELMYATTPSTARVVEGDALRDVPVESLERGQIVEVRAHESIPVDGVVVGGRSSLDMSILTGESRPVGVGLSDDVPAGAVNLSDAIRVRVEATGEQTRIAQLMGLIEEGARKKAPIVGLADRMAIRFIVVVVTLATFGLTLWLFLEPSRAVDVALSVLIVTCPCALGLATPLAVTAAIGRAVRAGVLIKGGDVVERLNRPGVLLLDKTGTITEGRVALLSFNGPAELRPLVAAIERRSSHPVARALASGFEAGELPEAEEVEHITGSGIRGVVNGRELVIGSPSFVTSVVGPAPDWAEHAGAHAAKLADTPVFVAVDGHVSAVATLGDPVREDASESVRALQSLGWDVRVLSGDHPDAAKAVGEQLGLDPDRCEGGASPERKLVVVEELIEDRPVVMVGDGVNDAAALARATVGVAVHAGAEASLAAADVYLTDPGLRPIVTLVRGSRRTMHVIRRNLCASLGYNSVAATLALCGLVGPIEAAILMPISSLTVLTLSYRSRTFTREEAAR